MKKIINGKKYDTDTATMMLEWRNNQSGFRYCYEALYRKKTGEYFLFGEGGAMTRYYKSVGDNTYTGGNAITPMTEKEAREWAESVADGDDYERIFGEVDE